MMRARLVAELLEATFICKLNLKAVGCTPLYRTRKVFLYCSVCAVAPFSVELAVAGMLQILDAH
jgi:hypothetical protein